MEKLGLQIFENSVVNIPIPVENINFSSDFFITCDSCTLSIGQDKIPQALLDLFLQGGLQGTRFRIYLDKTSIDNTFPGNVFHAYGSFFAKTIFTGFIDKVSITESRSGTYYHLTGRNLLGPLCDTQIDPWSPIYQFKEGQKLSDVLTKIFTEFNVNYIYDSDLVNRKIINGNDDSKTIATKSIQSDPDGATGLGTANQKAAGTVEVTIQHDPTNKFQLDKFSIKKIQPEHNETYMTFIMRNLKRFGLHCWGALNDHQFNVVVGKPNYNTDVINLPAYTVKTVTFDLSTQPQLIVAKSNQGSGKTQQITVTTTHVNEFTGYDGNGNILPQVQTVLNRYPHAKPNSPDKRLFEYQKFFQTTTNFPKVVYLEDRQSRGLDQLGRFVARKMSEYQSKAIQIRVTIPGFTYQDKDNKATIFKINSMVNFLNNNLQGNNATNNLFQNSKFWIQSCNFKQDRTGSFTELLLIPAYSLKFDPSDSD